MLLSSYESVVLPLLALVHLDADLPKRLATYPSRDIAYDQFEVLTNL